MSSSIFTLSVFNYKAVINANLLYVMVYSDREEVHLWIGNVQVYALIEGNVIAV